MKNGLNAMFGSSIAIGYAAYALAAFGGMPDVERIALPGEYTGHLQDVWYDGADALYWRTPTS